MAHTREAVSDAQCTVASKCLCSATTSTRAASYMRTHILIQLRALPYHKLSVHATLFNFLQHL